MLGIELSIEMNRCYKVSHLPPKPINLCGPLVLHCSLFLARFFSLSCTCSTGQL